ncbi:MAG: glycosyltransferase family 4 protein [SAR324 cluster bacterium]|nr:glycosyltransferase family 4 protein [SAR324 cluster bacterium]
MLHVLSKIFHAKYLTVFRICVLTEIKINCLAFILGFGLKETNLFGPLSETFLKMAEQGHVFHVICRESNSVSAKTLYEFPSGGFVQVHKIPQSNPLGRLKFLGILLETASLIIKTQKINVMYTHIMPYLAEVGITLSKFYRIPHVYWICSDWPKEIHHQTPFVKRTVGDIQHYGIMKSTDHIFTCTEFCRKDRSQYLKLNPNKFSIIPNAVNIERFQTGEHSRHEIFQKYNIPDQSRLILYFSSLSIRKGAVDLLHSIAYLKERTDVPFFILFCGHGEQERIEYEPWLRENKLQELAYFTGAIPSEEAPQYYHSCDIFCVPARYEGFGRVYVEAMACKKPIVSCKVGGIPEVVDHEKTGILTASKNPLALAEALAELLNHPQTAVEMGNAGYAKATRYYDQSIVAELTIKNFQKVIQASVLT